MTVGQTLSIAPPVESTSLGRQSIRVDIMRKVIAAKTGAGHVWPDPASGMEAAEALGHKAGDPAVGQVRGHQPQNPAKLIAGPWCGTRARGPETELVAGPMVDGEPECGAENGDRVLSKVDGPFPNLCGSGRNNPPGGRMTQDVLDYDAWVSVHSTQR